MEKKCFSSSALKYNVCEFGEERGELWKKGRSRKEIGNFEMGGFEVIIIVPNTKSLLFGELKNYIGGRFWRVYMNSSK